MPDAWSLDGMSGTARPDTARVVGVNGCEDNFA